MTELIQRWIQDRLGVLLDMSPEIFAEKAKDGTLLSQVLKSYEVITQDQLNFIHKTDSPETSLSNFYDHIVSWLNIMGIYVDNEELSEIVHAKGTAALNLFYQVYLELHPTSNLYFITQQRLKEKLRPENSRFRVQRVKEGMRASLGGIPARKYDGPLRQEKDIIHWQKDKIQMLQTKCKEARQEYMQYIKAYQPTKPNIPRGESQLQQRVEDEVLKNLTAEPENYCHEELVRQQFEAKRMKKFVPDLQESKRILKKLKAKQKQHSENMIFKMELQRDIYSLFWRRVHGDEEDHLNKQVTNAILKQSLYERQMLKKVEEVKLQKHIMLESKRNEAFEISKQLEIDFVNKLIMRDKEMDEKELAYYLEKERITELHNKLYEKKLKLKHANDYAICKELVQTLVLMACNEMDYIDKVGEEPPRRLRETWKKMFGGGIPFESFVSPTEIILMRPEERPEGMEEIVHLEIDKQEKIDKRDIEGYMAFDWPWSLDDIEIDEHGLDDMACALNILGNLVHNLLALKYPYPPLPPKLDLPNITISVCVNGLDSQCLPVLQEILDLKDILVVQIQDCINFCVNALIAETIVDVESVEDRNTVKKGGKDKGNGGKKDAEKAGKKSKKGVKQKTKSLNKKIEDDTAYTDKSEMVDKMVQTPKYYPEEKIPLTVAAELGKVAREVLESGEELTSHALVAMFIEFLKSKPDIKGWVLVNYPQTFEEATVLEEFLTGLPVSKSGACKSQTCLTIVELAELEDKPTKIKEVDELEERRVSKILPQPVIPPEPEFYDSGLTAYIKVIKQQRTLSAGKVSSTILKNADRNRNGDTNSLFDDIEDSADPLDKFYADLGCNYHFHYQKVDFNSIKYLAKLVLGDYSLPPKSSVELFGEAINYINADKEGYESEPPMTTKKGEKKTKPKEKKAKSKGKEISDTDVLKKSKQPDKKSRTTLKSDKLKAKEKGKEKKGGKKGKEAKVVIVRVDRYTQMPEVEEEEDEEGAADVEVDPTDLPKPGEKGWNYVNLPVSHKLQTAMATLWENAEEVYLVDLEQVFFSKRLLLNAVMPFVSSVKEHIHAYMHRPDEKQKLVREFQRIYNEFDDDFRSDDDFKAEVHCRINQMKEKLVEICDWKMIAADHERVFIINKSWTARQLIQLVNSYIVAFQLELDRFADTMVLLGDYYNAIVTKIPNDIVITKEVLLKLESDDQNIMKAINNLLQYVDESEETMIHQFVENGVRRGLNFVEATNNTAKSSIRKIKELLEMESKAKEKSKVAKPPKEKKPGRVGKGMAIGDLELEEDVLKASSQIIDEWNCATRGEVMRVKVRMELLKEDLFRNLEETLGVIRRTYYNIYDDIRAQHAKEIESINTVCKVLGLTVERELKIQEELILDKADFYIDPEVILFPDKLPSVRPLEETVKTGTFAINQLDKIVNILMDLSPTGYMPERSFSYLLQDLITSRDDPILVPELWQKLQPRQVDKISKQLFDDIEYVQWKDFIIYNLMLPFPTAQEILQLRNSFRAMDPDLTELITDYQYLNIKFWFEPMIDDQYKLKLVRQLIFKMYRVRGDKLNYTALLLDFCKDVDPLAGLAKALTVSVGNMVCWDKETGERFLDMTEKKKLQNAQLMKRKEQLEEGLAVVNQIVTEIMDGALTKGKGEDICDNIEVISNGSSLEEESKSGSIGLESRSAADVSVLVDEVPDMAYFLPLETLITVVTTCLPWHARVQNIDDKSLREVIEEIYEDCRHTGFDGNVLCHEFLNHPVLIKELGRTCRFTVKNPLSIVEDMVVEMVEVQSRAKLKKHW